MELNYEFSIKDNKKSDEFYFGYIMWKSIKNSFKKATKTNKQTKKQKVFTILDHFAFLSAQRQIVRHVMLILNIILSATSHNNYLFGSSLYEKWKICVCENWFILFDALWVDNVNVDKWKSHSSFYSYHILAYQFIV